MGAEMGQRDSQSAWTHCTSANWRLLSIKMDFGAKAQGRNNYFVPMLSELPEMLLGGDRWGAGWAQVSWTLPGDRQCLCGSHHWSGATVRNGKPQISLGPNVLRMITPRKTAFWMLCFLPLLPFFLMALGSLADTHNFQAANHRMRKTCQSNNETEKVFSRSGTSEFTPLHGFLWQIIKYYSSQHHHERESVWQGQGKEKLVPYSVCCISLVLLVPPLWQWRQALCQSFNQAVICPNQYWLVRPLHFLWLFSVSQIWNSIYKT